MIPLRSPIHDNCTHATGYVCELSASESNGYVDGWTWHRTLSGALRQSDAIHKTLGGPTRIYRILSDDRTEEVQP